MYTDLGRFAFTLPDQILDETTYSFIDPGGDITFSATYERTTEPHLANLVIAKRDRLSLVYSGAVASEPIEEFATALGGATAMIARVSPEPGEPFYIFIAYVRSSPSMALFVSGASRHREQVVDTHTYAVSNVIHATDRHSAPPLTTRVWRAAGSVSFPLPPHLRMPTAFRFSSRTLVAEVSVEPRTSPSSPPESPKLEDIAKHEWNSSVLLEEEEANVPLATPRGSGRVYSWFVIERVGESAIVFRHRISCMTVPLTEAETVRVRSRAEQKDWGDQGALLNALLTSLRVEENPR